MAARATIIEALKRLNPASPAEADWYVERSWEGLSRGWDLPDRLEVQIEAGYRVRALLHGAIGAGKSTELGRWAAALAPRVTVLQVKVVRRPPESAVSATELAFREALRSAFVARGEPEVADRCVARDRDFFRYSLPSLFEALQEPVGKPVLLLVDGLDLLDDEQARTAFGPGSRLLADSLPSVVFAAPHAHVALTPRELRAAELDQIWHLPPFGVVNEDGAPDAPAISALAAGLARRIGDLDVLVGDVTAMLERVAFFSGGVPRDAVRILREAVIAAAGAGRVHFGHIEAGIREIRQDLAQSLTPNDISALEAVRRNQSHEGAAPLVATNAVLGYQGRGRVYWLPHPLLWAILKQEGTR